MKSTFSVIYYLKRQVVKKDGTVPVMGRITVDGSQTQFSCKLTVDPKLWDTKGGRVTGRSTAALETNRMLDKMRVRINRHYQEIMERDNFVTAEKVKNAFLGLEHRYHTLMQVFRRHNEDYEKQVEAGMKAKGTLLKYRTVYSHRHCRHAPHSPKSPTHWRNPPADTPAQSKNLQSLEKTGL